MRIVVVGMSGRQDHAGAQIAALLPHIELDAINWQSGWRDLTRHAADDMPPICPIRRRVAPRRSGR
jgi:hypothetical protein